VNRGKGRQVTVWEQYFTMGAGKAYEDVLPPVQWYEQVPPGCLKAGPNHLRLRLYGYAGFRQVVVSVRRVALEFF
jgi:hypothetical protein